MVDYLDIRNTASLVANFNQAIINDFNKSILSLSNEPLNLQHFQTIINEVKNSNSKLTSEFFWLYFSFKKGDDLDTLFAQIKKRPLCKNFSNLFEVISIDLNNPAHHYFYEEVLKDRVAMVQPLAEDELRLVRTDIKHVMTKFNTLWQEYFNHILTSFVSFIGENVIAGSTIKCQSAMFAKKYVDITNGNKDVYYFDLLTHETAHQQFNILNYLFKLMKDPNYSVFSVARSTERPLYGTFHAQFVLYQLIKAYREHINNFPLENKNKYSIDDYLHKPFIFLPEDYHFRLEIYEKKFAMGIEKLVKLDQITETGHLLLETLIHSLSK